MSPKPSRAAVQPGKDIRAFFGSSQPGSTTSHHKSAQQSPRASAIEISDDDDDQKRASFNAGPRKSTHETSFVDISDDEIPRRPRVPNALKRKKPAVLISSDEDEEPGASVPSKRPALESNMRSKPDATPKPVTKTLPKTLPAKDKKSRDADDVEGEDVDEGDDDLLPNKTKKASAPKRKVAHKDAHAHGSSEANGASKPKFNWVAAKAAKLAGPTAPGSKPVPKPACENCLANLSFVFTGELSSFSREEAVELAKRFGGRVVGQPSSKTSFVVLGDNSGPSKLAAIKKHGLKTLNEDEFLNLIATRVVKDKDLDEKTKKKNQKEKEAIYKAAKELEVREKGKAKDTNKSPDPSSQLWTVRYAPRTIKEICGNKGQIEKLQQWLNNWPGSLKCGFKKPGKHAMGTFRAVLITGPPGIGKTTSAHICAKAAGFTVVELNASDVRSKKLVENGLNINNASLDGWMDKGKATSPPGDVIMDRSCVIMDEIDGMSAGDRGGVGALNALIKKTKIPIICIANDRGAQKLKPLWNTTFNLPFRRPEVASIRSRILSIAFKEKLKIPANVVDQLVEGSQSDIRQVLNMLSTWKLYSDTMDFDEGKDLSKMNEKYSILTPFDVTSKMLGPYLFSATARETLGDKIELYFHDHSFVPLFIQENYLKTQPARARNMTGPEQSMKALQLMDKAASSISDADLVDALIHGPEQHWTLMPLHAVCSTVRPASFVYGLAGGYGGPNAMSFPQWLGQNSKQAKFHRQLSDLQSRMRLKTSGNKTEIRQSYVPALFPYLVKPLMDEGASAVDEVIERMDEYFISKEDWDSLVELGLDQYKDDIVLKKIPPSVKTHFTKRYNSGDHAIPYHKAQDLGLPPKKIAAQSLPDLEEAFDNEGDLDEVISEDEKKKKKGDDITNDKLILAPKKQKGKAKNDAKGKK